MRSQFVVVVALLSSQQPLTLMRSILGIHDDAGLIQQLLANNISNESFIAAARGGSNLNSERKEADSNAGQQLTNLVSAHEAIEFREKQEPGEN